MGEIQELGRKEFSILLEIVEKSGISFDGTPSEKVTIFAPSNTAFLRVFPNREFDNFLPNELRSLVLRHIVLREIDSDGLLTEKVATPLGQELKFEKCTNGTTVLIYRNQRVRLLRTYIQTDFGILHELESVLLQ